MLQGQIMQILHSAVKEKKMKFIFLTLTVESPTKENLSKAIDDMFEGFNRLFKYKKVDNVVAGWVRVLEITRNNKKYSKNYDTYHPHFHVLIGVKPSYFRGQEYISQNLWTELWQKALKVDYKPIVNVQLVKPKREGQTVEAAVAETATYTVKETDYIHKSTKETDSVISVLAEALKNRRLIGYGKLFKDVKSKLKLKDIESENADLIGENKKECNCPLCGSTLQETIYKWNMGYQNYVSIKIGGADNE
jgi:plasmid rolling circle replication initiator protein Rep